MSATNYTPIYLYNSGTATNTPLAANLGAGELAINYADGKLFYKDGSAAVQVIAWKTTPTTAGGTGLTSYTAGDLPYYASGSALSKLGIGSANYVLTSSGTAPQYVAQSTLSVGSATNATNTGTTDDTTTNAVMYPVWKTATTGNLPEYTSSTKLKFNPSTGTLTATVFSGSGASLTSIPNSALTNSSITIGTTAVSLGSSSTSFSGLTALNFASAAGTNGITFNNSSATTNSLLNDYETGTWTPTDASGASLSLTINQTATYTKIGKIVNVSFNITYPTTASGLGASISLPFTASSNSHSAGAIGPNSTAGTVLPLVISANAYVQFGANNGFFFANSGFSGKQIIMTATYLANF
jgi:hypothetical protein